MKAIRIISLILILVAAAAATAQPDTALSGYVRYKNNSAARGVVLSVGNFNVTTDANGYYKMGYLKPGTKVVLVTPPGKQTRSFTVQVGATPTQKDFFVDW